MSLTARRTGCIGLSRQTIGDAPDVEKVGSGDYPSHKMVRVAGREVQGNLSIAITVAKQELPSIRAEDRMPVGDNSVGLAEMPVVNPEQIGRGLGCPFEAAIGADRVHQLGVDGGGASVGESRGDQDVGPAVLEGVGDLDVGLLSRGSGDESQSHASRPYKHPIKLSGLIDHRSLDVDSGELEIASLRTG